LADEGLDALLFTEGNQNVQTLRKTKLMLRRKTAQGSPSPLAYDERLKLPRMFVKFLSKQLRRVHSHSEHPLQGNQSKTLQSQKALMKSELIRPLSK